MLPDDIDLGIVGDGLERDVRHSLISKAVSDVPRKINERGISILNVHQTLAISDYGYVLSKGRVVTEGKPSELAKTKEVHQAYFG